MSEPIEAWAIEGPGGRLDLDTIYGDEKSASAEAKHLSYGAALFIDPSEYIAVRVQITKVDDDG